MAELPLVVGVDGSEPSLRAADDAALRGVLLRLVYAFMWQRYEGAAPAWDAGKPGAQMRAEDIVGHAARRAHRRRADVHLSLAVLPEEPEYALVRESRNACALVVGSRGRSGVAELLLGSVGLAVAAHADCPVIVLRGSHDNQGGAGQHGLVLLGVGEAPAGSAAVRFALREARLRDVPLEAVRAWRCPAHETIDHPPPDFVRGYPQLVGNSARLYEQRAAQMLGAALRDVPPDAVVRRRTAEGPARRALVQAFHRADLLVVGARRRTGHVGPALGRVAHAMLHHSACPVAVVPEGSRT